MGPCHQSCGIMGPCHSSIQTSNLKAAITPTTAAPHQLLLHQRCYNMGHQTLRILRDTAHSNTKLAKTDAAQPQATTGQDSIKANSQRQKWQQNQQQRGRCMMVALTTTKANATQTIPKGNKPPPTQQHQGISPRKLTAKQTQTYCIKPPPTQQHHCNPALELLQGITPPRASSQPTPSNCSVNYSERAMDVHP
ncbi:hypothetical protein U1Q18_038420 [Sarracenia purpurea var. burkii]